MQTGAAGVRDELAAFLDFDRREGLLRAHPRAPLSRHRTCDAARQQSKCDHGQRDRENDPYTIARPRPRRCPRSALDLLGHHRVALIHDILPPSFCELTAQGISDAQPWRIRTGPHYRAAVPVRLLALQVSYPASAAGPWAPLPGPTARVSPTSGCELRHARVCAAIGRSVTAHVTEASPLGERRSQSGKSATKGNGLRLAGTSSRSP